jgi:hypothetical protein
VYEIFDVKPADAGKIDEVLSDKVDDLVSRQSIALRDGSALGFPEFGRLVIVEGTDAGVARAVQRFAFAAKLEGAKAEAVYKAFKAQEDDVASGVGLIFG